MGQRTLLEESQQSWKLYVGILLMAVGSWWNWHIDVDSPPMPFILSLALGFGGGAWICLSIRCPRCSAKWFWLAASRSPSRTFGGAYTRAVCSMCGWPGENLQKELTLAGEDEGNTSLGSVVAFAGGLAAIFTFEPCFLVVTGRHDEDVPLLIGTAVGVMLAVAGIVLAKRTVVGKQSVRRMFAVSGAWLSRASLVVGIPTIMVLLARLAFFAH